MLPTLSRLLRRTLPMLALAGAGVVQAASSPFPGLTWSDVEGLKPVTWAPECPSRCAEYAAGVTGTVRVHEPVLGGAALALGTYRAWLGSRLQPVKVVAQTEQESAAGWQMQATVLKVGRGDSQSTHLLTFLTRDGLTVPLEFASAEGQEEVARLLRDVGIALIESFKLNPPVVKADLGARDAAFSQAAQALARGYARSERALLFVWSERSLSSVSVTTPTPPTVLFNSSGGSTVMFNPPVFSTQQVPVVLRTTLAFLPGGLFMTEDPTPDYRTPDLRRAWRGELPARWKEVSGGFQVTFPNGKTELYTARKVGGTVVSVKSGGKEYRAVPTLNAAGLAGRYGLGEFEESGTELTLGGAGSLGVRELDLAALLPGGGGRWTYHAPSMTLTFPLAGGQSGSTPVYADPALKELWWFPTLNANEWRRLGK